MARVQNLPQLLVAREVESGWPGFSGQDVGFNPYHPHEHGVWEPCTDVYECDNSYIVRMDLAGIDPESLSIIFERGVLTVRGVRPDTCPHRKTGVRQLEICYGQFQRRLMISESINPEAICAQYERGFLAVSLPKLAQPSYSRIVVHVR